MFITHFWGIPIFIFCFILRKKGPEGGLKAPFILQGTL